MKKLLLSLCAALTLSAILSAGSAAFAVYTDSSQIQYKTAVGVMSGAGILYGYTDNTFRPKTPITREQASKLLAYVVLGEDSATALPGGDTGFSDVSASRWSAPYIKWCRENGFASGLGDGSFDPEGEVTGYQLAKMLLCAAGYGQNGEYAGLSWELQAAKDGFAKGIFTGIANSNPDKAVTREEAAFYIYNAMTKLERVTYNKASEKYLPTDGTAELDNTFGAAVYGIILSGDKATTISGVVTENSANGPAGTLVSGTHYNYETGASLLGHQVTLYTSGTDTLKRRIYYISDGSTTVELSDGAASKDAFEAAFGANLRISSSLLVYDGTGVLRSESDIPGFDTAKYTAPAGSYIFTDGTLTGYFPCIAEYASVVGNPTPDGKIALGGQYFDADTVYSESGDLTPGEIVLIKKIADKIDVTKAQYFSANVNSIEYDRSYKPQAFSTGTLKIYISDIRNESGIGITGIYSANSSYRFYCDSRGRTFAVIPDD